jgi:tRNA(adenine34) deaminase
MKSPPDAPILEAPAARDDESCMRLALAEAAAAGRAEDVPVGAVIIAEDGTVLGRGRNRRELSGDPTAHAEIEALRDASRRLRHWRIQATIYVTQEPCPMCAGALVNARIVRLVYGCPNPKAGAVETLYRIPTDARLNHTMVVRGGVLAEECAALLRAFFEELRRQSTSNGEMAERLNAPDSKSGVLARVPGVRIPLSPPDGGAGGER